MNRPLSAFVVLSVFGALAARGQSAPTSAPGLQNEWRDAYDGVVLVVTYREHGLPLSRGVLYQTLASDGVLGAAARALDFSAAERARLNVFLSDAALTQRQNDEVTLTATLELTLEDGGKPDQPRVARLLRGMVERLRQALAGAVAEERQGFEADRAAAEARVRQAAEACAAADAEHKKLVAATGGLLNFEFDKETDVLRAIAKELRELETRCAGARARQAALVSQIAETSARAAQDANEDAVAVELRKVVELREVKLARVDELVKTGQASRGDALEAQEALALARADFARQRQAAALAAGLGLVGELRKELFTAAAEVAELEARRAALAAQRAAQQELLTAGAERQQFEFNRLMSVRDELQKAQQAVAELDQRMRDCRPPQVTVLGG